MSEEERSIRIRDVARVAGVSTATVSRAINRPNSVRPELRAKILSIINDTGYIPDASARAMTMRKTRTIGAIVPTIDNAMFAQGLEALQGHLAKRGYLLLLTTNGYDLETELQQARNLVERGIDALVLRGDIRHPMLRRLLDIQKIPFVNVGGYDPHKPYASVGVDNADAGRVMARHIVGLGHRRIAVIAARQRNNDRAQARVRGILDILEEAGCPPPPEWLLEVNYNLDEAGNAARTLLAQPERPTAFICGNDVIANGAMLAAIRQGVDVPGELSVAGFDDLEWSRHLKPNLTTIHIPTSDLWMRAGDYLIGVLEGIPVLKHQRLDTSLVVRESTAPPPSRIVA